MNGINVCKVCGMATRGGPPRCGCVQPKQVSLCETCCVRTVCKKASDYVKKCISYMAEKS